jgi:flagellar biosynthesis/type III secretory pathway protein FliH
MRAYSNMPTSEFVAQLRDIAIKANARPLVIDQLDAIVDAPSEDEIAEQITEAEEIEYKRGYQEGIEEGEQNKENAIEDALKEQYKTICDAIAARGQEKDIGLTETQVDQVINWILWDCRP